MLAQLKKALEVTLARTHFNPAHKDHAKMLHSNTHRWPHDQLSQPKFFVKLSKLDFSPSFMPLANTPSSFGKNKWNNLSKVNYKKKIKSMEISWRSEAATLNGLLTTTLTRLHLKSCHPISTQPLSLPQPVHYNPSASVSLSLSSSSRIWNDTLCMKFR